jgi:hypothetical protein
MGPLLIGGFIISLCFTISALYKFKPAPAVEIPHKQIAASHILKDNAATVFTGVLKRLITY